MAGSTYLGCFQLMFLMFIFAYVWFIVSIHFIFSICLFFQQFLILDFKLLDFSIFAMESVQCGLLLLGSCSLVLMTGIPHDSNSIDIECKTADDCSEHDGKKQIPVLVGKVLHYCSRFV